MKGRGTRTIDSDKLMQVTRTGKQQNPLCNCGCRWRNKIEENRQSTLRTQTHCAT
jgi:hypothetical protein